MLSQWLKKHPVKFLMTLCIFSCCAAHAQTTTCGADFDNFAYQYGIVPANNNPADAEKTYCDWKNSYVTSEGAGEHRRVRDDAGVTVSEGISYGMLLSNYFGDQALFDDLWSYYKFHANENGLMNWKISSDGSILGEGAATDADQDAAFALIMAHRRWGSESDIDYLAEARSMMAAIFQYEIEPETFVVKPGDKWGGSDATNPSYFSPAYYRVFKTYSLNDEWENVVDKSYEILEKAAHPETGLPPDWCDVNGDKITQETQTKYNRDFSYDYGYDAARTLLRISMDYLSFGEQRALDFCQKINQFFDSDVGVDNIVDGYKIDGTPTGQWENSTFVGTFAVARMVANASGQNVCDELYAKNVNVIGDNYFNWSIKVLTLFVQTGNLYYPSLFNGEWNVLTSWGGKIHFIVENDQIKSISVSDHTLVRSAIVTRKVYLCDLYQRVSVDFEGILNYGINTDVDLLGGSYNDTRLMILPKQTLTRNHCTVTFSSSFLGFTGLSSSSYVSIYALVDGVVKNDSTFSVLLPRSIHEDIKLIDISGKIYSTELVSGEIAVEVSDRFYLSVEQANWESDFVWQGDENFVHTWSSVYVGGKRTIDEGETATLDGSQSIDLTKENISFQWAQTEGPAATLSSTTDIQPTFIVPQIDSDDPVSLTFELQVSDNSGNQLSDSVTFSINNVLSGDINDDGTIDLEDAISVLKILCGLNVESPHAAADVDGDNRIGIKEAVYIIKDIVQ